MYEINGVTFTELQYRIHGSLIEGNKRIKFTEDELYDQMFDVNYWISTEVLKFFPGNNTTIWSKVQGLGLTYEPCLHRPIFAALLPDENGERKFHIDAEKNEIIIEKGIVMLADGHHRKSLFTSLGMSRIKIFLRLNLDTEKDVRSWYVLINKSLEDEKKSKFNMFNVMKLIPGTVDFELNKIATKYGIVFSLGRKERYYTDCLGFFRENYELHGPTIIKALIRINVKAYFGDPASMRLVSWKNILQVILENWHLNENKYGGDGMFEQWADNYIDILRVDTNPTTMKNDLTPESTLEIGKRIMSPLGKKAREGLSELAKNRGLNNRKRKRV